MNEQVRCWIKDGGESSKEFLSSVNGWIREHEYSPKLFKVLYSPRGSMTLVYKWVEGEEKVFKEVLLHMANINGLKYVTNIKSEHLEAMKRSYLDLLKKLKVDDLILEKDA